MNGEKIGLFLKINLHSRMMRSAGLGFLIVACQPGAAFGIEPRQPGAAFGIEPPKCPGDKDCYKEIRIINNLDKTIYAVVQGSIQTTPALGGCQQGDVWLQRALNNTDECFPVKHDYYIYINPTTGIPKGATASITLPWWSKTQPARDVDKYIDWWRAGRIYIFDDQTALNDSYKVNSGREGEKVQFAADSPLVSCTAQSVIKNVCNSADLKIYKVTEVLGSAIQNKSPTQLNEWTFADVGPLPDAELRTLNLNYNVSNVDQVYLPVAMEPIRPTFDLGYMGTLMGVTDFRTRMVTFTGANSDQTNAANWPIYNNPIVDNVTKRRKYPNAGIRVPSTLALFNFYMNPAYIDGNLNQPEIIPLPKPFDRDKLPRYVAGIEKNWTNCTTSPFTNCPLNSWYAPIKQAFDQSYKDYIAKCQPVPPFMAPVNNGLPSPEAYLRFVHGWVPFRVDPVGQIGFCTPAKVPDLPKTEQPPSLLGYAPVNYMKIQYDYEPPLNATGYQRFNIYTKFIHGPLQDNNLNASAYAFSIDDHESFQNHAGTGLIFAIGGGAGLPNQNRVPPAVPQFYEWYTAGVSLGPPTQLAGWKSYGVCSEEVNMAFPNTNPGTIGLHPKTTTIPCTITLRDTNNKKYQIKILKMNATLPLPYQIWPEFTPTGPKPNDPSVVSCPLNDVWCKVGVNEVAHRSDPTKVNKAPTFTLNTRVPQ